MTDRASIRSGMWPFDWHIHIWPWPTLKVKVKCRSWTFRLCTSLKWWQINKTLLLPANMKAHMGFRIAYLNLTFADSERQPDRWNGLSLTVLAVSGSRWRSTYKYDVSNIQWQWRHYADDDVTRPVTMVCRRNWINAKLGSLESVSSPLKFPAVVVLFQLEMTTISRFEWWIRKLHILAIRSNLSSFQTVRGVLIAYENMFSSPMSTHPIFSMSLICVPNGTSASGAKSNITKKSIYSISLKYRYCVHH